MELKNLFKKRWNGFFFFILTGDESTSILVLDQGMEWEPE